MLTKQKGGALLQISVANMTGVISIHSVRGSAGKQLHLHSNAATALNSQHLTSLTQESTPRKQTIAIDSACQILFIIRATAKVPNGTSGTTATIDASQQQPGSGYNSHPAIADSCLHTGAIFVPVTTASADDSIQAASAKLPVSVAAITISSQMKGRSVNGCMGGAELQPLGASFCNFHVSGGMDNSEVFLQISKLHAKPVMRPELSQGVLPLSILYEVEWRAAGVGALEGSLSRRIKAPQPEVEWALISPTGLPKPFKMQSSNSGPCMKSASGRSASHVIATTASSLAVVQAVLGMSLAKGRRIQLNRCSTSECMVAVHGARNQISSMAAASAAAVLKVLSLI